MSLKIASEFTGAVPLKVIKKLQRKSTIYGMGILLCSKYRSMDNFRQYKYSNRHKIYFGVSLLVVTYFG